MVNEEMNVLDALAKHCQRGINKARKLLDESFYNADIGVTETCKAKGALDAYDVLLDLLCCLQERLSHRLLTIGEDGKATFHNCDYCIVIDDKKSFDTFNRVWEYYKAHKKEVEAWAKEESLL